MLWHFLGHTLGDKPQHELESMDAPGLHGTQTEEFLECPDKATGKKKINSSKTTLHCLKHDLFLSETQTKKTPFINTPN